MSSSSGDVLVIGGGVVGVACAYYLQAAGWKVTLIDQSEVGRGCSHGNCGLICPSHVLPLAAPGAVRVAVRAFLQRNGPFSIKARFDPALWSWLLQFARKCNHHDMISAGHAIQGLLNSSRALYDELIQREGLSCEWEHRGLLFVFQHHAALNHYTETDHCMRKEFGVPARRLDSEELVAMEPALKPGLAGAWYYEADAHLRPDRLMTAWRKVLEQKGVAIHERCAVEKFIRDNGRLRAITTSKGEMSAEHFVFAVGAWTPLWQRGLGCKIPIQPGKGYSITMARPAKCPTIPLIFEEHRVVATPMQSGYRLGSTMEFAGYDRSLSPRRLELLRAGARPYLHEPLGQPVEEEWYGWRPMTYDGKPIIDRCPELSNTMIAAGHNMLGLSMAPATGKLVAEILSEKAPHLDPAPYSLKRF